MKYQYGEFQTEGSASDKSVLAAQEYAYETTDCTSGERYTDCACGFYAGVEFVIQSLIEDMFRDSNR